MYPLTLRIIETLPSLYLSVALYQPYLRMHASILGLSYPSALCGLPGGEIFPFLAFAIFPPLSAHLKRELDYH